MKKSIVLCVAAIFCMAGSVFARPQPVAGPVVIGQWTGNLEAAKLEAVRTGAPMLVVFSMTGCSHCSSFDRQLDSPDAQAYFANRGLIMVYEHASTVTSIGNWARGPNRLSKLPLVRITWFDGSPTKFKADANWERSDTLGFARFSQRVDSYIVGYTYPPVPLDPSKDAYDPENDTVEGATELTWGDQPKTETNLKLASKDGDEPYADLQDWYQLPVVSGATYRVWFSDVSGIAEDAPQAAVYGAADETSVWAEPAALANDTEFEFAPTTAGTAYIKVWRAPTSTDTNILYTLHYQRFAPGTIEFVQTAVAVNENAGSVTLQVRRTGGTTGEATVQIGFEDRNTPDAGYTATAGQDFNGVPSPATLTWADGDAADKTVTFALIKDVREWEGDETFGVTLTSTTENEVGPDAVVTLLEVDPKVTRAASYNGWVSEDLSGDEEPSLSRVEGTMTLAVSATGRITGKAVFPRKAPVYAGTYTVRNAVHQNIDVDTGVATITGDLVKSRERIPFELQLDMESGEIHGTFGTDENERMIELFRDDWAQPERQALIASLQGYYTVAFPVAEVLWPEDGAPMGSGYAVLTVDGRGRFRASGKLGDGTSLSQSGVLAIRQGEEPSVCAMLFTAPATYQGGAFSGMLVFGDRNGNEVWDLGSSEEIPIFWVSLNPTHVATFNGAQPGFMEILGAVGGWYDKKQDLAAFYDGRQLYVGDLDAPSDLSYTRSTRIRNEAGRVVTVRTAEIAPSVSWQAAENLAVTPKADGSGFTVPAGDLVKTGTEENGKPIYNYDTGVNPNGLKLTVTRTSGLMRGTFNAYYDYPSVIDTTVEPNKLTWRRRVSRLSYAGILLQEQAETGDVVAAYGYYLSPEKIPYPDSTRTYSFKRSLEFRIHAVTE